ncbi:MAG TPA: hypothetical protein VFQ35_05570, partial [Polyangiaceae bacterium]|nr:hypothetical protein [Polyangiaceae bacterium]
MSLSPVAPLTGGVRRFSNSVQRFGRDVRRWFASLRGDPTAQRRLVFELAFALAALSLAWPLFVARYVPIQDLPQHAAAVRVLHDYRSPAFGFERWFEIHWASTQYVAVYFAAHLLAYLFEPVIATKLVLAASLVALPYALRALLQALRKPASYALLVVPLVYNTQLVLGFLNFVFGLPLMFAGLALFVRYQEHPTRARLVALSLVTTLCFLSHVVPYGMLVLGALALSAGPLSTRPRSPGPQSAGPQSTRPQSALALSAGPQSAGPPVALPLPAAPTATRRLNVPLAARRESANALHLALPFAPSLLLALIWSASTPAGKAFSAISTSGTLFASREPFSTRLAEIPFWLNDILWSHEDEHALFGALALFLLIGLAGLAGLAGLVGSRAVSPAAPEPAPAAAREPVPGAAPAALGPSRAV